MIFGAKVILYAVWQINTYTVTYNYTENGGSSATKTSASVNYGSAIDLTPTATKSGYTFVGWNTNKDGTSKLSSLKMSDSNVTLYAIYSKTITATCYYYSGTAQTSKKVLGTMYNNASAASINLGTTSLTGYTFRGWSTSNSGNATISAASNGSVSLSANATYYACYKYTVKGTYKYYNGTDYTSSTATATVYMNSSGTKVGGKPTAPAVSNPSGWTARGWSTSNSSTGTVAIPAAITSNTTYYYSWKKTITVTYDANGGTNAPDEQKVTNYLDYAGTSTSKTITISSDVPKRSGYTFKSWNAQSDGSGKDYAAGTKSSYSHSLYAQWTINTYTITYTLNGGTNAQNAKTSYNVTTATFTLPTPKKTGYTFSGWYTSSDFSGSKVTSISKGTTGNKHYYAKWQVITNYFDYTDTFNVNHGTSCDSNGWITMTYNNKNGSQQEYCNFWTTKSAKLKVNTTYRIAIQVKSISGTGILKPVSNQSESVTTDSKPQFDNEEKISFSSMSAGDIIFMDAKTISSFTNSKTMIRSYAYFNPGQSGSITFRISVLNNLNVNKSNFTYVAYK